MNIVKTIGSIVVVVSLLYFVGIGKVHGNYMIVFKRDFSYKATFFLIDNVKNENIMMLAKRDYLLHKFKQAYSTIICSVGYDGIFFMEKIK